MSDWLEQLSELEHLKASWERRETNSFQPYRKAVTDSASALIERARRAEELEREVQEWRDTVSGEPPTLLRRLLAVAQSHNDPLRGLLLRVWKREQQLESENHRLFRALEACRAEMERQGMDTSTPVRELHRAARLRDA